MNEIFPLRFMRCMRVRPIPALPTSALEFFFVNILKYYHRQFTFLEESKVLQILSLKEFRTQVTMFALLKTYH